MTYLTLSASVFTCHHRTILSSSHWVPAKPSKLSLPYNLLILFLIRIHYLHSCCVLLCYMTEVQTTTYYGNQRSLTNNIWPVCRSGPTALFVTTNIWHNSFTTFTRQSHGSTRNILSQDAAPPQQFQTERAKVAFIISLLTGKALQWAKSTWGQNGSIMNSLTNFADHFKEVFGQSANFLSAWSTISSETGKFALHFQTFAAASEWNKAALIMAYCQVLKPSQRLQLAI